MKDRKGWKKSTIWAKLYRWFYCIEKQEMPDNLCPYFHKSVWMYFAIIPYTLFSIPVIIISFFDEAGIYNSWQRIGFSCLIYLAILAVWGIIFVPYFVIVWGDVDIVGFWEFLFAVGVVIYSAGILIGGYELIKFIGKASARGIHNAVDGIGDTQYGKKSVMIVEFAKAKYHKYCPKIEWEDD